MEYYLHLNDEQRGPYTLGQLQSMWRAGSITGNTLFWQDGRSNWVPLSAILHILEPPPSPPPSVAKPAAKQTPRASPAAKPSQSSTAGCGFLFVLGVIGFVVYLSESGRSKSHPDLSSSSTYSVSASEPISDISWQSIDSIYNLRSKNTDFQKDEAWTRFKGKRVRWTGAVSAMSTTFGSLTMQVKMNPSSFTSDVIVTLNDTEKYKASRLRQGESVTYVATLNRWGTLMPISMDDGQIIN